MPRGEFQLLQAGQRDEPVDAAAVVFAAHQPAIRAPVALRDAKAGQPGRRLWHRRPGRRAWRARLLQLVGTLPCSQLGCLRANALGIVDVAVLRGHSP